MSKKVLIHAWAVESKYGKYYIPYTHWVYLKEILNYFDEVVLLSSCTYLPDNKKSQNVDLSSFDNVTVYELPAAKNYVSSIGHFFSYVKAYRSVTNVSTYYSRYPTPFGWLQKIFGRRKNRIIHYVGDPVDAAKNNPNFSYMKKKLLISGFFFENILYNWSCRGARVFTNGHHLSQKLYKNNIYATPLISSTLNEDDFYFTEKKIQPEEIRFIYLGYLRAAKGVETIINAYDLYNKIYPNSSLVIIGSGELEESLKKLVKKNKLKNIRFLGHVEDREKINSELRSADIFLFASLSEGSPRVILEAMANGLAVVSTPVGSLPTVFKDKEDIVFSDFNNPECFLKKMIYLASSDISYNRIRRNAYIKVKDFTLQKFISRVFNE